MLLIAITVRMVMVVLVVGCGGGARSGGGVNSGSGGVCGSGSVCGCLFAGTSS